MSIGKNQTDYQKYFAFFKNNYQKGIHNLATLLSTPTQAEEFINNLGGVSVVFGVPYSNKDPNSDRLFDILMSSDYGSIALDVWLEDKYNISMKELTEATTFIKPETIADPEIRAKVEAIQAVRRTISTDAVAFRAVASTEELKYFIDEAMAYEAAAKVIAGAYLPMYQLVSDENNRSVVDAESGNVTNFSSFDTTYRRQRNALIGANADVMYKALLKYCDLSNDDNNIINDTAIDSLDSLLMDLSVMKQVCDSYTTLMCMVSMESIRDAYTDEGQSILNAAVRNASQATIEKVVGYTNQPGEVGNIPMQFICDNDHLWEAFFNASHGVALGLKTLFGINIDPNIKTIDAIVGDSAAVDAIVSSGDCIVNMLRSNTALTAIAGSDLAMRKIIGSEPAMIAIANSASAMATLASKESVLTLIVGQDVDPVKHYPIAMHAIANSEVAMEFIASSQMAITKIFSNSVALAQIMQSTVAYKALNRSPIALEAIFSNASIVDSYLNNANSDVRRDLIEQSQEGMEFISSVGDYSVRLITNDKCLPLIIDSQNAMNALANNEASRTAIWTHNEVLEVMMNNAPSTYVSNVMCIAKLIAGYAGLDPHKYNTCQELFALETDINVVLNGLKSRQLTISYKTPASEIVKAQCTSYDVNGSGSIIHAMAVVAAHIDGRGAFFKHPVAMTEMAKSNQAISDIIARIDSVGVRDALQEMVQVGNAMDCLYANIATLNNSQDTSATMYMANNEYAMDKISKYAMATMCLVANQRAETEMVANTLVAAPAICVQEVSKKSIVKNDTDASMLIKMIKNKTWFDLMVANGWFTLMCNDNVDSGCLLPAWQNIAADATAMQIIAANATAMNAIAASTTAMNAIAASTTAMNAINNSSTAINIVKASRVAMYYIGKYNSVTTARSNFATTHANITGLNDSLMSAYLAGWLGAAAYSTYTNMAGILGNNSYLTTLGGNSTLMTLLNANSASCTAIGANLSTGLTNGNNTWLNACGNKANIMTAIDANSNARTLIVNNIAKAIAATTFWTACCGKSNIMTAVAASSTAMTAVAASSTAMTAVAASSTAMTAVAASSTAMTAVAASSTAMTAVGSYQNSLDKIWASTTATDAVCAGAGFASLVTLQSTLSGYGYAAANSTIDYGTWNGKKIFIKNGTKIQCSYVAAAKNLTVCKGSYKLECYGGGSSYNTSYSVANIINGAKGGYSYGTLTLTNNTTVLYCYTGGKGAFTISNAFNGGGAITLAYGYNSGGGGGTDIRINSTSLYARVIVAGGAGGAGMHTTHENYGGSGGGTSGGTAYSNNYGNSTAYCGQPGTATAGGAGGTYYVAGGAGTFGKGGNSSAGDGYYGTTYGSNGGAGGGGWYGGGGCGGGRSGNNAYTCAGGGGGSGYVYTSSTASQYPSGCLLNSSYYLTSAATSNSVNAGNGYIYITKTA